MFKIPDRELIDILQQRLPTDLVNTVTITRETREVCTEYTAKSIMKWVSEKLMPLEPVAVYLMNDMFADILLSSDGIEIRKEQDESSHKRPSSPGLANQNLRR